MPLQDLIRKFSDDGDDLLDTPEAAQDICHAAGTLCNWRVQGKGPVFEKRAGKVFYRRSVLREWAKRQVYQSTSAEPAQAA